MLRTRISDLLGIEIPVVAAGMGRVSGPHLAAAVSDAGALGTIGAAGDDEGVLLAKLREARRRTSRPLAMNFVLRFAHVDRVRAVLELGVEAIAIGWGDPAPLVPLCHEAGTRVMHRVENARDARAAVAAGVDVLIAQGSDAGGHTGSVPTFALIPAVVDAAQGIPVLAAGGVADGRGLAASLALGADGAVIGTRLLASLEANAHERYKSRVLEASETDSVLTDIYEIGWPDAPHRVLRNATVVDWEAELEPKVRPTLRRRQRIGSRNGTEIVRWWIDAPTPDTEGAIEEMPLYAGPSAALAHELLPAADIIRRIASEAEAVVRALQAQCR